MILRARGRTVGGGGGRGDMDLGTRALWCGVGALAGSWIPLLNIVAFVAALMAVGFGSLARWPTGWLASEETDTRRALWGIVLGVVAIAVFAVTSWLYGRQPGTAA